MTRGGKYANKTPRMRFLHKYTGTIILSIFVVIVIIVWSILEDDKFYFENFSCEKISSIDHTQMLEGHIRFHEIRDSCDNQLFTPKGTP